MKRTILLTLILLVAGISAVGHDYWFAPESFFLPVGGSTAVHLYVGDEFKLEEERVLQKDRTVSFELLSAGRAPQNLLASGVESQSPVARPMFKDAGNYLLAMERPPQPIELAADKFTAYLKEEGLEQIISLREKFGESNKPGREHYSRYLKALFQVGAKHDDTYKLDLGQKLEIVPLQNPYQLKVNDRITVRITFEGQPLVGTQVSAYVADAGAVTMQTKKTDHSGLATLLLDRKGAWLIRLVHMRRCANCQDADWESFWGALSFGVR
jgi:uncharacterized GH25 family protein